jgi:hypothetical protein
MLKEEADSIFAAENADSLLDAGSGSLTTDY